MRREKLTNDGISQAPPEQGGRRRVTGLGKPLKLLTHPERDSVPYTKTSPRSARSPSRATAEYADGWLPFLYYPERAKAVWGEVGRQRHRQAAG